MSQVGDLKHAAPAEESTIDLIHRRGMSGMLYVLAALALLIFASQVYIGNVSREPIMNVAFAVLGLVSLIAAQQVRKRYSPIFGALMIALVCAATAIAAAVEATTDTYHFLAGMIFCVIISGMVLRGQGLAFTVLLLVGVIAVISIKLGDLQKAGGLYDLFVQSAVLAGAGGMVFFTIRSLYAALEKARAGEQLLRERNAALEAEIAARTAAEAKADALSAERDKLAYLTELMGNLTHDMKSPLSAINMSLHIMQRDRTPDTQQVRITKIRQQVDLLEQFIRDSLTLTRLEENAAPALEPVDIGELLADAASTWREAAANHRLSLVVHTLPRRVVVAGSRADLLRAVTNLVENAVHYTPDGGKIDIRSYHSGREIVVEVADSGIGIAPEELPHVFERFYRASGGQAAHSRGSGLGLAIVRKIVERHGGSVNVESHPGEGTTFRIHLPRRDDAGDGDVRPVEPSPDAAPLAGR